MHKAKVQIVIINNNITKNHYNNKIQTKRGPDRQRFVVVVTLPRDWFCCSLEILVTAVVCSQICWYSSPAKNIESLRGKVKGQAVVWLLDRFRRLFTGKRENDKIFVVKWICFLFFFVLRWWLNFFLLMLEKKGEDGGGSGGYWLRFAAIRRRKKEETKEGLLWLLSWGRRWQDQWWFQASWG